MNTNRLSKGMNDALNQQLTKEANAAQIFLAYGCWASASGFPGIGNFLFRHSHEERNHMQKIVEYILQRGGTPVISAIPAPPADPENLMDCFEKVFQHEVDNTNAIYQLVELSMNEKDWATWNFAQWFVKEQVEEEALALDLLDKVKMAQSKGTAGNEYFDLDKTLEKAPDEIKPAEQATTSEP